MELPVADCGVVLTFRPCQARWQGANQHPQTASSHQKEHAYLYLEADVHRIHPFYLSSEHSSQSIAQITLLLLSKSAQQHHLLKFDPVLRLPSYSD